MSKRHLAKDNPATRRPDLIAELNSGGDFALVQAESAAGLAWIHSHPCPAVIDDICVHPLIVEAYELEDAERAGLVLWRVYSGHR